MLEVYLAMTDGLGEREDGPGRSTTRAAGLNAASPRASEFAAILEFSRSSSTVNSSKISASRSARPESSSAVASEARAAQHGDPAAELRSGSAIQPARRIAPSTGRRRHLRVGTKGDAVNESIVGIQEGGHEQTRPRSLSARRRSTSPQTGCQPRTRWQHRSRSKERGAPRYRRNGEANRIRTFDLPASFSPTSTVKWSLSGTTTSWHDLGTGSATPGQPHPRSSAAGRSSKPVEAAVEHLRRASRHLVGPVLAMTTPWQARTTECCVKAATFRPSPWYASASTRST